MVDFTMISSPFAFIKSSMHYLSTSASLSNHEMIERNKKRKVVRKKDHERNKDVKEKGHKKKNLRERNSARGRV